MNPVAWRLPTRLAAAALSGGLLLLAFPPIDVGWAAFAAAVPLLLALRGAKGRTGFLVGLVAGMVFLGALIWWISLFGLLAWTVLVVGEALFFAVFGWFGAWASRSAPGRLIGVPLIFTALEILRTRWPLGGFAWGDLGYAQHNDGLLLPLARIGGVHLITLALLLVSALLAHALANGRVWRRGLAFVVAAGIAVGPAWLPLGLAGAPAGKLDVALVQGNVPEGRFTGFADRVGRRGPEDLTIIQNHIDASLPLADDPPDLVVWPENAVDRDPLTDPDVETTISNTVQHVGAPFIVGAILNADAGRFRNSNVLFQADGHPVAHYDKIHLVPFGEYVPWPQLHLRRYIHALDQIPADGVPGTSPYVFQVGDAKVAAVICFESTYPLLVRSFVREGAQVIIVSTNDASFRRSPAARQHLQMSQLRAVEEGRVVLHTAISGITAVIDPSGRVHGRTALFTQAIVRRAVPLASGETPYSRWGDAIELGLIGAGALAAMLGFGSVIAGRRDRRYGEAEHELWGDENGPRGDMGVRVVDRTPAAEVGEGSVDDTGGPEP